MFGHKFNKYEYFYPAEFVSCGSETQPKVGEKLNYLTLLC